MDTYKRSIKNVDSIMPKILDRLVGQLQRKGVNKNSSYAIAVSKLQKSGNLKRGTENERNENTYGIDLCCCLTSNRIGLVCQ